MTTWSELEEVKSVNVAGINTGKVTGGSLEVGVFVTIDNKGSLGELETRVSQFVETSTGWLGGTNSSKITWGTNGVEGGKEGLGWINVEGVNNKGEFGNVVDVVASCEDKGSNSWSSKSGSNGVSLLGLVDLSVPLSPCLKRSEHTTLSAHVTESTLAGSWGTWTTNTWNTGDSATSSPGLSWVLMALKPEHSVCLTSVLWHVCVDELDGIVSNRSGKHCGNSNLSNNGVFFWVNTH